MSNDSELVPFDSVEEVCDSRLQVELLNMAWEDGNSAAIAHALSVIAKARGMAAIAREAGITRPALYKALSGKGNPSLSSMLAITKALGVKVSFDLEDGMSSKP